mmetsp:Transcript_16770/g.43970  ORF Transcript_16770/g.43970 Transcript_16770/m.43970 type:complete len:217 (-) Transcript_16770:449-1099(-)
MTSDAVGLGVSGGAAAAPPPTSSPAGMRPPPKPVSRVSARPTYPSLARAFMSSARASSRVSRPASATQTKASSSTMPRPSVATTQRHGVGMTVSVGGPDAPPQTVRPPAPATASQPPANPQARARPAPPTEKCDTSVKLSLSRTSTAVPAQRDIYVLLAATRIVPAAARPAQVFRGATTRQPPAPSRVRRHRAHASPHAATTSTSPPERALAATAA